jgi:endonuclease YncB( thermonuclease family)
MIRIFSKGSPIFFGSIPALLFLNATLSFAGQCTVTLVTGGDAIQVIADSITTIVRLAGIDAPEVPRAKGQPFSEDATQHLEELVLNKAVKIISYGSDRLGRTLAEVFVENRNVNIEMLKAGYAQVYRGNPIKGLDTKPYWEAEKEARIYRRGMWSLWDCYRPQKWKKANQN